MANTLFSGARNGEANHIRDHFLALALEGSQVSGWKKSHDNPTERKQTKMKPPYKKKRAAAALGWKTGRG